MAVTTSASRLLGRGGLLGDERMGEISDTHPAYKVLRQLSKPKPQPGRQLQHGISGRQLHTASDRIVE